MIPELIESYQKELNERLLRRALLWDYFRCVVARSWRERLFSWPWRPWVKTKWVFKKSEKPGEIIKFRRLDDTDI